MDEKNRSTYKVVKHNNIIQKTRLQLPLQEQKIIAYIISMIKPNDKDFKCITFDVADFCRVCDIDYRGSFVGVKKAVKSLRDRSAWVPLNDNQDILLTFLDTAIANKGTGTMTIKISDIMKPHLIGLGENFTEYELKCILGMCSQYSPRLYELFKSHLFKGKISYELTELKSILDAENYEIYQDFKRRVLEKAISEINEKSDIHVEFYVTKKIGRSVSEITFHIKEKRDNKIDIDIIDNIFEKETYKEQENIEPTQEQLDFEKIFEEKADKPKTTKSKQQKVDVEEIVEKYTDNVKLDTVIQEFIEHRKQIKKPMNKLAITKMLNELDRLSGNDDELKIDILNQSIINGWSGVFPIKRNGSNNKKSNDSYFDYVKEEV